MGKIKETKVNHIKRK